MDRFWFRIVWVTALSSVIAFWVYSKEEKPDPNLIKRLEGKLPVVTVVREPHKNARIVKVLDGDTFRIEYTVTADVRILELYCPETRTRDLEEKARGIAAKKHAEDVLGLAEEVGIRVVKKDAFGRWLAKVLVDGKDYSEIMIKAGHGTKEKVKK